LSRRKHKYGPLSNLEITQFAAEGKCIARLDEQVVFIPFTAPGDIIDAQVTRKKKNYLEARATHFHQRSDLRIEPKCAHFSVCGGCKWQHISYEEQLIQKEKQVINQLDKIGKVTPKKLLPIIGAPSEFEYRNKVELSFCHEGWIEDVTDKSVLKEPALGFHVPGRFDKVLNVEHCHLVNQSVNDIIQYVGKFTKEQEIEHYNIRMHTGILRNLIVRTSSLGGLMVILVITEKTALIDQLLQNLDEKFSEISSLNFVINTKKNDTIFDLDVVRYSGDELLYDQIGDLKYKVRPKSFFQTNSTQVFHLYEAALKLAQFNPSDVVYDLYTGTGSIALFMAKSVQKVVGIEILPQAIDDARENAKENGIDNCTFFVGDMKKAFTNELIAQEGKPDVIMVDPPRNGMDKEVIETLLTALPRQIIYISCNPATQARDLALLSESYEVELSQAVDMFPQTHHIENIVSLQLKR
jgi:23S rRNA (uracil1939-C5)-methyltransferase